jgi:putative transposase
VHKTANILDKMPKSVQGRAKELIHEMYLSPTRKAALSAYDQFISSYEAKYPKAVDCLQKDKERLFTFYDFPAKHWSHLRSTNPIESTFATVRLRTKRTKRLRLADCHAHDGLQTRPGSTETLAPA